MPKIVIDIDTKEYERIIKGKWTGNPLAEIIENGTPLDDIKAEINDLSELDHIDADYEDCKADVLEIIDKHISGKDGE